MTTNPSANLPLLPPVPRPFDDPVFQTSFRAQHRRFLGSGLLALLITLVFTGAVLFGAGLDYFTLSLPLLFILYALFQFRRVRSLRRLWSTGAVAAATLTGNRVLSSQRNNLPAIEYSFRYYVDNKPFHGTYDAPSGHSLTLTTGSSIGVAYDPRRPHVHMLLIDPRHLREGILP